MKEPFDLSASRTSFCGITPAFPFVLHATPPCLAFLKNGQAADLAAHPLKKRGGEKGGNVGREGRFLKSLKNHYQVCVFSQGISCK